MRAYLVVSALAPAFCASVDWDTALAGISDYPRVSKENCANLKEIQLGKAKAKSPISHAMSSTMSSEALVKALRAMAKLSAVNCKAAFGDDPRYAATPRVMPLIGRGFCRGSGLEKHVGTGPAVLPKCLTNAATAYFECRDWCVNDPECSCFSVAPNDGAVSPEYTPECPNQPRCVKYVSKDIVYTMGSMGYNQEGSGGIVRDYASFAVIRGSVGQEPNCLDTPASRMVSPPGIPFFLGYPCSGWHGYCVDFPLLGIPVGSWLYNYSESPQPWAMAYQTKKWTPLQLLKATCPIACAPQCAGGNCCTELYKGNFF